MGFAEGYALAQQLQQAAAAHKEEKRQREFANLNSVLMFAAQSPDTTQDQRAAALGQLADLHDPKGKLGLRDLFTSGLRQKLGEPVPLPGTHPEMRDVPVPPAPQSRIAPFSITTEAQRVNPVSLLVPNQEPDPFSDSAQPAFTRITSDGFIQPGRTFEFPGDEPPAEAQATTESIPVPMPNTRRFGSLTNAEIEQRRVEDALNAQQKAKREADRLSDERDLTKALSVQSLRNQGLVLRSETQFKNQMERLDVQSQTKANAEVAARTQAFLGQTNGDEIAARALAQQSIVEEFQRQDALDTARIENLNAGAQLMGLRGDALNEQVTQGWARIAQFDQRLQLDAQSLGLRLAGMSEMQKQRVLLLQKQGDDYAFAAADPKNTANADAYRQRAEAFYRQAADVASQSLPAAPQASPTPARPAPQFNPNRPRPRSGGKYVTPRVSRQELDVFIRGKQ